MLLSDQRFDMDQHAAVCGRAWATCASRMRTSQRLFVLVCPGRAGRRPGAADCRPLRV